MRMHQTGDHFGVFATNKKEDVRTLVFVAVSSDESICVTAFGRSWPSCSDWVEQRVLTTLG